jgi:nucleoside phosphorylase
MVMVASVAGERVKPAYTAERLNGNRKTVVHAFDKAKRKIVKKEIEVPAGVFVRFAKGHSNVLSEAEFERLQRKTPEFKVVDMETGLDLTGKV